MGFRSHRPVCADRAKSAGFPHRRQFPTPQSLRVATPLLNVPLRLVGVIGRLYVVLESDRGLVLLDQHAAHERILFEQMLNRIEQKAVRAIAKIVAA